MTEGGAAVGTAAGMAHGAKEAATETIDGLLDLVFGVILPIGLAIAGLMLAGAIGGVVTIGNALWGTGSTSQLGLTGPQNGAIASSIITMIYGGVALGFWHASSSSKMNKWGKFITRAISAFFVGLTARGVIWIGQTLSANAISIWGGGGVIDNAFSKIGTFAQKAAGG